MLLNNLCESFNSFILPARDKPILSLCEWIRRQMMGRFVSKREVMTKWDGNLTPYAKKLIEAAKQEATRRCQVFWGGGSTREVHHRGRAYVVDLEKRTCMCNKWDLTGIPCAHAMCCILKERMAVDDFVHEYYSKDRYGEAYGGVIHAMPSEFQYEDAGMPPPQPPKHIVQAGRPKKHSRKRGEGEEVPSQNKRTRLGGPVKCSNCRQAGHRRNKCTNEKVVIVPTGVKNKGGRPKNPSTVLVGSQKRNSSKKPIGESSTCGETATTKDM